ncbi:uncharacterized mitochondrial protein AtMg00810-like [Nicotiana sylvestris]|uniref:Uncharacterized mitochondrial protein AtMg00810-like n=1 Tax=Nicotiana tabacum TaxID=4097 RepID=A0A1S4B0T1_TOBAC|nr:PREDICTED: uncharacterized mitochondrial protein AtMg00810-like [Nicotiana tabacum]
MTTVRTAIAIVALRHWSVYQMGVHNAFPNGDLAEEVYMTLPQGFGSQGESEEGILMCQRKYTLEMISEAGLLGAKPKYTPMEQNLKLTSTEYDECVQRTDADEPLKDRNSFQRLIGKLLYLTITRPDIAYAV